MQRVLCSPQGLMVWGFPCDVSRLWAKAEIKARHLLLSCSISVSVPVVHARMMGHGWEGSWDSPLMLLSSLPSLPALLGDCIQLPQQGLKTQTPF